MQRPPTPACKAAAAAAAAHVSEAVKLCVETMTVHNKQQTQQETKP
jgi:hypothetical protein